MDRILAPPPTMDSRACPTAGPFSVTITFTLADEGRLKPLDSVDLSIPSKDKHKSGGFMSDLSLSLATRKVDGKQVASVHLKKELAGGRDSTQDEKSRW